jgi:ribosomal protein S12 methylthiotransferase
MAEGLVLPYLDIPFQHASPRVLKAMRRPANQAKVLDRINAWRKPAARTSPSAPPSSSAFPAKPKTISSTCWTGCVRPALSVQVASSTNRSTVRTANDLPGAVPEEVKEERWHRFMEVQAQVSAEIMQTRVGREIDVLIDAIDEDEDGVEAVGRSVWDAPEIDGNVFLPGEGGLKPGDLVRAKVVEAEDYDLIGELI